MLKQCYSLFSVSSFVVHHTWTFFSHLSFWPFPLHPSSIIPHPLSSNKGKARYFHLSPRFELDTSTLHPSNKPRVIRTREQDERIKPWGTGTARHCSQQPYSTLQSTKPRFKWEFRMVPFKQNHFQLWQSYLYRMKLARCPKAWPSAHKYPPVIFSPFYSCNICCSKQLSGGGKKNKTTKNLSNTNFLWLIVAILGPVLTSLQARWSSGEQLGILIPFHSTAVRSEHGSVSQLQLVSAAVLQSMRDPADSEVTTRRKLLLAGSKNSKKGSKR